MFQLKVRIIWFHIIVFIFLSGAASQIASAQQTKKPFTVADEIGLTIFNQYSGQAIRFSPDGNYVAVSAERGRLDLNCPEDSLRFYRSQDIEDALKRSGGAHSLSPRWVVTRSTDKEGPIIKDWRWLADSSGVVFLERILGGSESLVLADIRKKKIERLTSVRGIVKGFDVRDSQHYVYTSIDLPQREKSKDAPQSSVIVGTGRPLLELLFPGDPGSVSTPNKLWAVVGGKRFQVSRNGLPIVPEGDLALSPDGHSLVTTLLVHEVPLSWETLYPPPFPSSPYRIRATRGVKQFVRVNVETGSVEPLTDAPTSNDGGWLVGGSPSWSSDGQAILLPGTFLSSKDHTSSRPCVAFVDLASNTRACVEMVEARTETGAEANYRIILGARFAGGNKQRVMVSITNHQDASLGTTEYRYTGDGTWQAVRLTTGVPELGHNGLEVAVKQGLNEPPVLMATSKQTSQVIWDPNPQLKSIELGEASVYRWKDKEGRDWRGGLYKPTTYNPRQRYPLVIQTHGFTEWEFRPSGVHPTAFAARALAAAGMVVLQAADEQVCPLTTSSEAFCAVSGYEAAVKQLASEGLVDPNKVGIIGFSRTCFYVMATLTTSSLHLKAASITDGFMVDYFQYMLMPERLSHEADLMIGAPPFGEGLQQWLKRSPGFMLDKVNAPLLIVGEGPNSLLFMWEPYAGLRYLKKPVELLMLNTDEHILTNPGVRMASQGGSVDWFRFWLKDEEDLDPDKVEQYKRWSELRKLQEANEKKVTMDQSVSN